MVALTCIEHQVNPNRKVLIDVWVVELACIEHQVNPDRNAPHASLLTTTPLCMC